MTESEAIETLIGIRLVSGYSKSREEALDMAIAALEKQEGKKPKVDKEKIDNLVENCPAHRKYSLCPSCWENLKIEFWTTKRCFGKGTILKNNKNPKYCPDCGQRIDWSDEL